MSTPSNDIDYLLTTSDPVAVDSLFSQAAALRDRVYGRNIFLRGLIEISNHCRNNCLYCGIRRDADRDRQGANCQLSTANCQLPTANCLPGSRLQRYRLTKEQILDCCQTGHSLGFRTFVLQGGEDAWFTDEVLCDIVAEIKRRFPDCAVTLSLGERGRESFRRLREAGADRYLLRHETADADHYAQLHPSEMSFEHRMQCLYDLRELGYQVGTGFMVGSPFQTIETLKKDLAFIAEFRPEMVGIGPFIPADGTPFQNHPAGSIELTLRLLAIIRLTLPNVLLPATTALGTLHPTGRERAIAAGANVIMPNLSPQDTRALYSIYNNKLSTQSEAAETVADIRARLLAIGFNAPVDRGDHKKIEN